LITHLTLTISHKSTLNDDKFVSLIALNKLMYYSMHLTKKKLKDALNLIDKKIKINNNI